MPERLKFANGMCSLRFLKELTYSVSAVHCNTANTSTSFPLCKGYNQYRDGPSVSCSGDATPVNPLHLIET